MIILKYCARLKIKANNLTLYSLHDFSSTSPWIKSPKPGPLKFDDRRRKTGFRQIRPSMIFLIISDRDLGVGYSRKWGCTGRNISDKNTDKYID